MCVHPSQVTACTGIADRERCEIGAGIGGDDSDVDGGTVGAIAGTCQEGVCLPAACGNGRLDHLEDEVCDDRNNLNGDGCSGNCKTTETCGNGIVDIGNRETCDDRNDLDHDNCSSACLVEAWRWVRVREPGALGQMRAAYDAARGTVVMFGGKIAGGTSTNATSEWRGYWRSDSDIVAPLPRDIEPQPAASFSLAYDHERRRTVLVGGTLNGTSLHEVLGWDGARWTRLADLPVALSDHTMAYDAKRKRIVLFGGRTLPLPATGGVLDETWEFDGVQWTKAAPSVRPTPRFRSSMAFDPKRGVIVMYGGTSPSDAALHDVWEYDGVTWLQRSINGSLTPLIHPQLAYDTASQRMAILGGGAGLNATLYLWDGTIFSAFSGTMPSATGPSGVTSQRSGAVLVEDGRGRLMLYGGEDPDAGGDRLLTTRLTWTFDGAAWTEALSPPALTGAAMVDAPDQGKVILFGGKTTTAGAPRDETWELSRNGWRRFTAGAPPAMAGAPMVYDPAQGRAILFNGSPNGLWIRTGTTWTQMPTTAPWPETRTGHSIVWDVARGELVLFGGGSALPDTWTWNGSLWTRHTVPGPVGRIGAAFGYDRIAGVSVLFGGTTSVDPNDETWLWNGMAWRNVTTDVNPSPPPSYGRTLTWNPGRTSLVLTQQQPILTQIGPDIDSYEWFTTSASPPTGQWRSISTFRRPPQRGAAGVFVTLDGSGISLLGGTAQGNSNALAEHWELRFDAENVGDTCELPFDVDGDAVTGCGPNGDPDCWMTCTPDCPPGVSCSAATSRCGDGTCSPIETCYSCPDDCSGTCPRRCGDFICDSGETCVGDCP